MKHWLIGWMWLGVLGTRAAAPELNEGVYLQTVNGTLTVGLYPSPAVVDWNGDGKKDLMVGQLSAGGTIALFLNQGTDAEPLLDGGQLVSANGQLLSTSAG